MKDLPLESRKEEYWNTVHSQWYADESNHYQLRKPGLLKMEYHLKNGQMISLSPKVGYYLYMQMLVIY